MTRQTLARQGQSRDTEFKERGLEAAFTINLRVFYAKFGARHPYWHFDLNSGSGINEDVGCIGSPLAFLRAAAQFESLRYMAGFCDTDAQALRSLMARPGISGNRAAFCFHGRNASLIQAIPRIVSTYNDKPQFATGLVLSDPNGFETPIDELAWLSQQCPRLDVAIHWNSRVRRLYRGHDWHFVDIDEAIAQINKRHWLIRKPMGSHQWTVLIGRNTRIGEHRTMGFYHLDSDMGRHILSRCKARIEGAEQHGQLALGL
jgi:hypothetical protein